MVTFGVGGALRWEHGHRNGAAASTPQTHQIPCTQADGLQFIHILEPNYSLLQPSLLNDHATNPSILRLFKLDSHVLGDQSDHPKRSPRACGRRGWNAQWAVLLIMQPAPNMGQLLGIPDGTRHAAFPIAATLTDGNGRARPSQPAEPRQWKGRGFEITSSRWLT
ncbi:hypothetical protein VTI74DRAFT_9696 [Chaetomium olivicolor]